MNRRAYCAGVSGGSGGFVACGKGAGRCVMRVLSATKISCVSAIPYFPACRRARRRLVARTVRIISTMSRTSSRTAAAAASSIQLSIKIPPPDVRTYSEKTRSTYSHHIRHGKWWRCWAPGRQGEDIARVFRSIDTDDTQPGYPLSWSCSSIVHEDSRA